jgi:dihydrofolate reductase
MRKLIVSSFVSLDGVIESPWEWIGNFFGEQQIQVALKQLHETDYFLMARKTYERFSTTWPNIKGVEYFDSLNAMNKLVVSNTLTEATWNTKVIKGDIAAQIEALKKEPGKNILKYGVGDLDKTLLQHRLIDEFKFSLIPMAIHKGRRLFENIDMAGITLNLANTQVFNNGVVDVTYKLTYQKI